MSLKPEEKPQLPTTPKPEAEQITLFEKGNWFDAAMQGMPEFVQENLQPFKTVYVHFETREDMDAFTKLVGQKINLTTRSIWYPEATIEHWNKRWVDAEPPPENPEEGKEGIETVDEQ